jgi:hypothetical protein
MRKINKHWRIFIFDFQCIAKKNPRRKRWLKNCISYLIYNQIWLNLHRELIAHHLTLSTWSAPLDTTGKKKQFPQKNTQAWVDRTKTQALLCVESVNFSDDI